MEPLGLKGSPRTSFGRLFEGALRGCNWTILLHTTFGEPAQNSVTSMAGIGTDPVPSRPRLRLDNGAISGLQAESGGACKRRLWLPLRTDIGGFTVRSVGFSRFANHQGTEVRTGQSETPQFSNSRSYCTPVPQKMKWTTCQRLYSVVGRTSSIPAQGPP